MKRITVCCLKKGDRYRYYYVNILAAMVRRNVLSTDYDFVCFTDDPAGIDPEIRVAPLPYDARKWWGKMGLYMNPVPGIHTERLLYLDLDVVITGPLDQLLTYPSDFAMARDWPSGTWPNNDSRSRDGQSSVVLLKVGAMTEIWERYCKDGYPNEERYGDQEWVNRFFHGSMDLLPECIVQSYKLHKLEGDKPPACSVVMFHGTPKPPDCSGWVKEYWRE